MLKRITKKDKNVSPCPRFRHCNRFGTVEVLNDHLLVLNGLKLWFQYLQQVSHNYNWFNWVCTCLENDKITDTLYGQYKKRKSQAECSIFTFW